MLPNYQSVILTLNVTNKKEILPTVKISYKLGTYKFSFFIITKSKHINIIFFQSLYLKLTYKLYIFIDFLIIFLTII